VLATTSVRSEGYLLVLDELLLDAALTDGDW